MNDFDFSFESIAVSLLITVLAYMIFPLMLRLTRNCAYERKEANKISIINSVIVAIIFFILRESAGDVQNNAISFAPAFLYYGINYGLLQWKFKPKNFTYLFMILSIASSIAGWYTAALLFGPVSFILAYGGLRISRISNSWKRIVFYIEAFLGLFIFYSYLHSITLNIGILYVWGFIYSIITMILLHFIVFKRQIITKKNVKEENESDEEEYVCKTKNRYCKKCGSKLNSNNICKKCGKKYFKFDYKVLSIILSIFIVGLIGGCIYLYALYDKATELYADYLANDIIEGYENNNELDSLNNGRTTLWTKEKLNFFDENIVFVIEGYEDYYYTYDCMIDSMDGEYSYWAYNKEQAISRGYKRGSCN